MRLAVGQQILFTAKVKIPLTQIIQRVLHNAMPSELPTTWDLYFKLKSLGVGREENLSHEDVANAAYLLVLEGRAVEVETERGMCFAWPLGREFDLFFSF